MMFQRILQVWRGINCRSLTRALGAGRVAMAWATLLVTATLARAQLTSDEIAALANPAQSANSFGISPDGKHLAFGAREKNELCLYVVDLDNPSDRRRIVVGTDLPANNEHPDKSVRPAVMTFVDWKNDRRIIFQQRYGKLQAIDLDGKNRVELARFGQNLDLGNLGRTECSITRNVVNMLPREPEFILVEVAAVEVSYGSHGAGSANLHDYFRVDVATGKAMPMSHGRTLLGSPIDDEMGNVRGYHKIDRMSDIGEYMIGEDKDTPEKPLSELLGVKLAETYGLKHHVVKDLFRAASVYGFGYWQNTLFFTSSKGRDTYALYVADLKNKKVEGPLWESDRVDLFGSLVFVPQLTKLGGMRFEDTRERTAWLLPEFEAIQKDLDTQLPQRVNRIAGWDDALKRFAVFSYSDRDPGSIAVYDAATKKVQRLGSIRPQIDYRHSAGMVAAWIKARAGHDVLCYITAPAVTSGRTPAPMVVLLHGGPWARDSWEFDTEVQFLAAQGYLVLQVNFRGSEGFGYAHLSAACRNFGNAALEDVEDAIDWVTNNGVADRRRIFAMGSSYGGYLALYAAAKRPDLFRGCIARAAVTDLVDLVAGIDRSSISDWRQYEVRKQLVGDLRKDKELLRKTSPVNLAAQIAAPVLLIHGKDDGVVPIEHSERMRRKLESAKRSVEYIEIKDAMHGGWNPAQQRQIWDATAAFLRKHDSGAAAASAGTK
ncbi:MAG: S9 family peptidase [Opitutae bacterium]|nr:S9 family peptidase [Opitutae bacterium]